MSDYVPPPDGYPAVYWAAEVRCRGCGRMVKCKAQGRMRRHWCRLRWVSRRVWAAHLEGWHSGYRWAVEHPDDPLVLADGDDYGTGWAAHMRAGHVTVVANDDEVSS